MKTRLLLIGIVAMIFSFSSAKAQGAGDLYTGFNGTGYYMQDFYNNIDVINDIAVQEDNKIVAVGVSFTAAWSVEVNIIRVMPDGLPDVDFGTIGVVNYAPPVTGYYEAHAITAIIKDDGKILVAGGVLNENFIFDFLMIQLNPDGSFDSDFGVNGISTISINQSASLAMDIAIDDNGKILLTGTVANAEGMDTPAVVRINANGTLDTSFGNNGVAQVPVIHYDNDFSSIYIQPDGKILASGHISIESSTPFLYYFAALVVRFNADGSFDNTFGTDGIVVHNQNGWDDEFYGMDLNDDGEIICGGFTKTWEDTFDMFMMKFDTDGHPVPDFGDNGVVILRKQPYNVIYDLVVQSDNKILTCGTIGQFGPGDTDFALVRFLQNGELDTSFGNDGIVITDFFGEQDEANSLALAGNNKIYVGGKSLNSAGNNRDFTIACYVNDISTSLSLPVGPREISVYPNPASGFFNIDDCKNAGMRLFSIDGKLQYSATISQEQFRLDISNLPKGLYTLVINTESDVKSTKVVVE